MHPGCPCSFVVWLVALGGLAATTNYCVKDNDGAYCSRTYQLEWVRAALTFASHWCLPAWQPRQESFAAQQCAAA